MLCKSVFHLLKSDVVKYLCWWHFFNLWSSDLKWLLSKRAISTVPKNYLINPGLVLWYVIMHHCLLQLFYLFSNVSLETTIIKPRRMQPWWSKCIFLGDSHTYATVAMWHIRLPPSNCCSWCILTNHLAARPQRTKSRKLSLMGQCWIMDMLTS